MEGFLLVRKEIIFNSCEGGGLMPTTPFEKKLCVLQDYVSV